MVQNRSEGDVDPTTKTSFSFFSLISLRVSNLIDIRRKDLLLLYFDLNSLVKPFLWQMHSKLNLLDSNI